MPSERKELAEALDKMLEDASMPDILAALIMLSRAPQGRGRASWQPGGSGVGRVRDLPFRGADSRGRPG